MTALMTFPLAPPEPKAVRAMDRSWARHRLDRYLKRWARTTLPEIPEPFWDFTRRACDLGCGYGRFLIEESARHPDWGYLGIDKGAVRGGNMVQRFAQTGRPNLFGIHANLIPVLAGLPDGCLNLITIFYPNPWWPAKHHKKRWSYHPLLPKLVTLLKEDGVILLTSNEAFYLSEWQFAMTHHPDARDMALDYAGPIRTRAGRTHFEAKFIERGISCGEIRFRRVKTSS